MSTFAGPPGVTPWQSAFSETNAFEHHVIETDLEPDDVVTLVAHARKHHRAGRPIRLSLVVGEGDTRVKAALARCLMSLIVDTFPHAYFGQIDVLEGESSATRYPTKNLPAEWLEGVAVDEATSPAAPSSAERYKIDANYAALYSDSRISTVFLLKPPREAIRVHRRLNLHHITAHAYGGFNWRVTGAEVGELRSFAASYQRLNYLFRFTAVGDDSLYQIKVPVAATALLRAVSCFIFNWNTHIVQRAQMTLRGEAGLGTLHNGRTSAEEQARGIISSIEGKERVQFVLADVLTLLCEPPAIPMCMTAFDGKESKWAPDAASPVFVHDPDPDKMAKRRIELVAELDGLFEDLAVI